MVDVFISYSRTDHARVAMLARAVEAEGYEVWWDADLPPHQSYGDVITAKIGAARAAIVVWSADAVKSEWVRAEADMARNQKKLVQTAVGGVMPPLPFNQIQFAEIGDWQGEPDHTGWRKVRASLAELCGKGADPREYHVPVTPPQTPRPVPTPSRWPLLAGGGVAVAAVAALGGVMLSKDRTPAPTPVAVASVAPSDIPGLPDSRFDIFATVRDPDGYVNLREQPSTSGAVVGKIEVGKPVRTFRQAADWWIVRGSDGKTGYVARSRLVLPDDGAATPGEGTRRAAAGPPPPAPMGAPPPDEALPGPPPAGARVYFPDSSVRVLDAGEYAGLTRLQLRIARNEIFARNGRAFKDPALRAYFAQFPWYRPQGFMVRLNPIEQQNVAALTAAEATAR